jgi:hypothetical protein
MQTIRINYQDGSVNSAYAAQLGNGNRTEQHVWGGGNSAYINQEGDGNIGEQMQGWDRAYDENGEWLYGRYTWDIQSYGNSATINQFGSTNEAYQFQRGDGHSSLVLQVGNSNTAMVRQSN